MDAHLRTVAARIRGTLAGSTAPVNASTLAQRFAVPEDFVTAEMAKVVAGPLVKGSLQGGSYTPSSFLSAQTSKVEEFYAANGYVAYSLVKSVGISKPKEWLKEKYGKGGMALEICWLNRDLLPPWASAVSEALASGIWVDIASLVPPLLDPPDIALLVPELRPKTPCVVAGTVLASPAFVDSLAKGLDDKAKKAAELAATKPATAPRMEDDAGSKKKPKGKKGKADKEDAPGGPGPSESDWLSSADIVQALEEPEAALRGKLQPVFQKYLDDLRRSQAEAGRATQEDALAAVQASAEQLQLSARAMVALDLEATPLGAFFFRELGKFTNRVLAARLRAEIQEEKEVTNATRKQLLDKLTKEMGKDETKALTALAAMKAGEKLEDVSLALLDAAEEANLFCRKVDKKREKTAASEARAGAKLAAESVEDPLPAATALLRCHFAAKGNVLLFPDEVWAVELLAKLEALPEPVRGLLAEFPAADDPAGFVAKAKALL